jgi:hypothetical protein
MNDQCEIWSAPWHVLQRNLAAGIGTAPVGGSLPRMEGVIVNSWLARAHLCAIAPSRHSRQKNSGQ